MKRTRKVLSHQFHAERFNLRIVGFAVAALAILWLIGHHH